MDRRRRTGKVVNLVHLHIEREGHAVPHHPEVRVVEQMQVLSLVPV